MNAVQPRFHVSLTRARRIHLMPTLLGEGERLFEGVGSDLNGLALVRTVATTKVIHVKFVRT